MHVLVILLAFLTVSTLNVVGSALNSPLKVTVTVEQPKFKIKIEEVKLAVRRTPKALIKSVGESVKTLASTCAVLIPVSLAVSCDKMRPLDKWLLNGVYSGANWAKTSAVFVGAETFFGAVRNKQDKLNRQLASGVSSSFMKFNEGPVAVTQGFCMGFGLMYLLDKCLPDPNQRSRPSRWLRPSLEPAEGSSPSAAVTPAVNSTVTGSSSGSSELQPRSTSIGSVLRSFTGK